MVRWRRPVMVLAAIAVAILGLSSAYVLSRPATAAAPRFVDETVASGLAHRYDGPDLFQVGGGVAVFDCDGNGLSDVYLAGGERPAALFRNRSTTAGPLRFDRVASATTDLEDVNGAYPLDLDGDGLVDLAVLRIGENVLLRGLGDCAFERANDTLGFRGVDGHTTAFSATWEGDAALPTLAIGHYLELDAEGKATFTCDDDALLRPALGSTSYAAPLTMAPGYCALSMLFSSWDGSARRDLRVSNDRAYYTDGSEQLWRIDAGQTPDSYTANDGWSPLRIFGMGIASQDLTGDGLPEIYLTSQADNKLQTLAAGPTRPSYRDIALASGVISTRPYAGDVSLASTAWHAQFADVNNDGLTDLFVSKGNVGAQPDFAARDPNDLFLGRPDGTFVQEAEEAGLLRFERGRGAAVADLNLDGLLDLVVVNYGADTVIWRNVGTGTETAPIPMGHWMMIDAEQPAPNRDAIGALVDLRIGDATVRHELTIGGGHLGGQLGWLHLGLGRAESAELRVTWPDGEVGPWLTLAADRFWTVERGAPAPRAWTPDSG